MIRLRAHHGMCLFYFRGIGYSDSFTQNMTAYKDRLEKDDPLIQLLAETDDICAACPHNKGGLCDSSDKTEDYDRAVLAHTALREGSTLHFSEFTALVSDKILKCGKRPDICGSCTWNSLCRGPEENRSAEA